MIVYLRKAGTTADQDLFNQMHALRAEVFHERLNWDVAISDGAEIDKFDSCDPLYVLSVSDDLKTVIGSVRLLKTLGPNMLRDVFSDLLDHGEVISSPVIWESSRFCISPDSQKTNGIRAANNRLNSVTIELLFGIVDVALSSGILQIVSVFDARMLRILRAAGCQPRIVGTPRYFGKVKTFAGLFDISTNLHQHLQKQLQSDQARSHLSAPFVGTSSKRAPCA